MLQNIFWLYPLRFEFFSKLKNELPPHFKQTKKLPEQTKECELQNFQNGSFYTKQMCAVDLYISSIQRGRNW